MTDNLNFQPQTTLNVVDAGAVIIGFAIAVGIFKTPTLVAANFNSEIGLLLILLLRGLITDVDIKRLPSS